MFIDTIVLWSEWETGEEHPYSSFVLPLHHRRALTLVLRMRVLSTDDKKNGILFLFLFLESQASLVVSGRTSTDDSDLQLTVTAIGDKRKTS